MSFFLAISEPSVMRLTKSTFPSDDKSIICLCVSSEERSQIMDLLLDCYCKQFMFLSHFQHEVQFQLGMIIMISLSLQCIGQFVVMA